MLGCVSPSHRPGLREARERPGQTQVLFIDGQEHRLLGGHGGKLGSPRSGRVSVEVTVRSDYDPVCRQGDAARHLTLPVQSRLEVVEGAV